MKTEKLKFEQIQNQLDEWILEVTYDLKQDWNDDKENMKIQLQLLLNAKANLGLISQMGGQIFSSSISK